MAINQADCRHPRLALRYALAILCSLSLLGIFAIPLFVEPRIYFLIALAIAWLIILLWITTEIFYAFMVDNAVLVSELNYPRIQQLAEEVRGALALNSPISIFVYEQGDFNAMMVRLFRRRAIFLQSEVLEAGVSDDEVRWLVGRFVGYLRVQQDSGVLGWLVRVTERSGLFTLLVFPYIRAMVYTGDRLGLAAVDGDIGAAVSVMQKLMVGRQLGYSVNPLGIIDQRRKTKGSIFAFLARVGSPFPSSTARYVDLICFARQRFPEAYRRFEANTPGLPADMDALSGERTSANSVFKAIAGLLALIAVIVLPLAGIILLLASSSPAYDPSASLPYVDTENQAMVDATEITTDANAVAYDDTMTVDAVNLATNMADSSAYYGFCVTNYSDYTISYEVSYGASGSWQSFNVVPGQTMVVSSQTPDTPTIRFINSIYGGTAQTSYSLGSSYLTSDTECTEPHYYFRVSDGTVKFTTS